MDILSQPLYLSMMEGIVKDTPNLLRGKHRPVYCLLEKSLYQLSTELTYRSEHAKVYAVIDIRNRNPLTNPEFTAADILLGHTLNEFQKVYQALSIERGSCS